MLQLLLLVTEPEEVGSDTVLPSCVQVLWHLTHMYPGQYIYSEHPCLRSA